MKKFRLYYLCLLLLPFALPGCGSSEEPLPPAPVEKPIAVSSVALDKTSLELLVDSTAQLTATVSPDNAENKSITWKSSDTAVATVSDSGQVTAIAEGKASITVKTTDGGHTATCTVTVSKLPEDEPDGDEPGGDEPGGDEPGGDEPGGDEPGGNEPGGDEPDGDDDPIHVSGVTLNKTGTTLYTFSTVQLTATVSPADAEDKNVTWSSSNPTVASVDENGKVKALKTGTAIITVTTTDGGHTATCTVRVITYVPDNPTVSVDAVTLSATEVTLDEGQTAILTATITPSNAADKSITWTSSDTTVATVDSTGKITALKAGEATIIATSSNGQTATCTVIVRGQVTGEVDNTQTGGGGSTGEIEW